VFKLFLRVHNILNIIKLLHYIYIINLYLNHFNIIFEKNNLKNKLNNQKGRVYEESILYYKIYTLPLNNNN